MRTFGMSLLVLAAASVLVAAPADEKAPEGKPSTEKLTATVVSVSGPAQKLAIAKDDKKWLPLKAKDELDELTVIRTGLGAKVVLQLSDRGEIIINNATKIGIGELRKDGEKVSAELGLKYGTMRASVDSTRGENDFRIATPVATLSVRGSAADVGFMADSTRTLDARAGLWRVLRTITLVEGGGEPAQQIIRAGETANAGDETPIAIALRQRAVQVYDTFGVTVTEQTTLTENTTGIRVGNTPSGGGGTAEDTTSSDTVTPPTDPQEPGYP